MDLIKATESLLNQMNIYLLRLADAEYNKKLDIL